MPAYYGFGGRHGFGTSTEGVFFREQAVALAHAGHDVSLLYVHFDGNRGVELETINDTGVRGIFVHAKPLRVPVNLLYRVLLMIWAFHRSVLQERPNIIHAHSYRASLFAWPISKIWGVPYVITEHSSTLSGELPRQWRLVARWGFGQADAVLAVSNGLALTLRRYTRRKVLVIPNLVQRSFFTGDLRAPKGPRRQPLKFLSVGRCHPNKGWDVLLQSFALLVHSGVDAILQLCGGGAECPDLERISASLGVDDRVQFLGRVDRNNVRRLMEECDCHVMASRVETFGIVNVEALALGKPIIMTDTDAASTIVNDTNGLVVPIGDVEVLALSMKRIAETLDEYDSEAIRERCSAQFSEAAVCARLTEIYFAVLAENPVRSRAESWRPRFGRN
ncbi:glycosyltransferase [Intrasporangium calvum]|uniref:glycosyltransferase n=1 Tax=Intrasporangium calvum TaxID=53358 RepID=UPI0024582C94|nr:glycosyltransferase [Intrasporangium calvum]